MQRRINKQKFFFFGGEGQDFFYQIRNVHVSKRLICFAKVVWGIPPPPEEIYKNKKNYTYLPEINSLMKKFLSSSWKQTFWTSLQIKECFKQHNNSLALLYVGKNNSLRKLLL